MKYIKAIFNVISDIFCYSSLKGMGISLKDIIYFEFHPADKPNKIQEIINRNETKVTGALV